MKASLIHIRLLSMIHAVFANEYDPHIYPDVGPFFEGWYARLTDQEGTISFGLLFGTVLPEKYSSDASLSYLSVFRSNGSRYSMIAEEEVPAAGNISVTVKNGSKPSANPDTASPPDFQWVSKPNGYFNVTANGTVFDVIVGDIRFVGKFGPPVPWGPGGLGPEGWLSFLPLPIHWFVYSLGTPGSYRWVNLTSGESIEGSGHLHQEKNWGQSFPSGWIWAEGLVNDGERNVSFAGTFGTVHLGPLPVPAMLFGYRNFIRGISLDFRSDDAVAFKQFDACRGMASVTVMSLRYTVTIEMAAKTSNFQTCLCGPERNGFLPVVTESFETVTRIRVTQHMTAWDVLWRSGVLLDDTTLNGTALEFGGAYLCTSNPCKAKKSCQTEVFRAEKTQSNAISERRHSNAGNASDCPPCSLREESFMCLPSRRNLIYTRNIRGDCCG